MNNGLNKKWQAEWIRFGWNPVVPYLRKSFEVEKKLVSARLRSTALGVYELWLNGKRISDEVLQPGWTDYRKRVYFREYDLTVQMLSGKNMLGAIVAPGWYAGFFGPFEDKGFYGQEAYFSCELELSFEDGSQETITTDSSWRGHAGPILSSDLLMGEAYDARLELGDWSCPDNLATVISGGIFTPSDEWGPVEVREEPVACAIEPYTKRSNQTAKPELSAELEP